MSYFKATLQVANLYLWAPSDAIPTKCSERSVTRVSAPSDSDSHEVKCGLVEPVLYIRSKEFIIHFYCFRVIAPWYNKHCIARFCPGP